MRTPVAYIRKSRVFDEKAGVSWEVQEAKVRELAAQYGDNHGRLVILSDMNLSGRKGAADRPGYAKLLEMIKTDQVSAIYSYNLARLSRSVQDLLALVKLADKHGTVIRLADEHHIDTSHAMGRMMLTIIAAVDEMAADIAAEHARDAVAARRARGDRIGHPNYGEDPKRPGENVEAVVTAYRDAGSVLGAARLLNDRKVPTRMGGLWSSVSARELLVRVGAMPARMRPGAKARAPYMFYGLLRCHCGHILTGSRYKNGSDASYCSYKCHIARTLPHHGLGAVPEKRILAWAKVEAARLTVPESVVVEQERQVERDKIEARKLVIADMYETNGPGWRDEYLRRLGALKVEEEALAAKEAVETVLAVPEHIDWDNWSPEDINRVLATRWERVELDVTMEPIRAIWRVGPEWLDAAPIVSERIADLPAAQREAIVAKLTASRRAAARAHGGDPR